MLIKSLVWIGIVAMGSTAVLAAPKNSTRYVHYSVDGKSAPEILKSLHKQGPVVRGLTAYATTYAEYSQTGDMIKTAKSCKVRTFGYNMAFTIKLPKHRNEKSLTGKTLVAWSGFTKFVKAHEEIHRQIWLNCAKDHARTVATLSGKSCDAVEAKAESIWRKNRAACDKRHVAFDESERKVLARQSLIRLATRKP